MYRFNYEYYSLHSSREIDSNLPILVKIQGSQSNHKAVKNLKIDPKRVNKVLFINPLAISNQPLLTVKAKQINKESLKDKSEVNCK